MPMMQDLHLQDQRIAELENLDSSEPDSLSRLAQIKRDHNHSFPVGRLPFETLSAILEIDINGTIAEDFGSHILEEYRRLVNLSTVCAYWRDVVEGTARFWRKIDDDCPLQLIRKIISKCQRLKLYYDIYGEESYPSLRALFKAAEKWEDVRLRLPTACIVALEKVGSVPILRKLSLEGRDSPSRAVNLFGGEAPQLNYLELARVALPWDCPLKNLTTLKMTKLGEKMAPSVQELLSIISACPTLTHFELEDWKRSAEFNRGLESTDAPHLSQVTLSASPRRLSSILRYLRAPVCQRLELDCRSYRDEQPGEEIFNPIHHRHLLDCIKQYAENDDYGSIDISVENYEVGCRLWTPSFRLFMDLSSDELGPVRVLSCMSTTLGRASQTFTTSINLGRGADIADEALFGILNTFPKTKTLSYFPEDFEDADPLVDHLMTPDMFPHLESLELQFCEVILDDILKMVEMRCGRQAWIGQGHLQSTPFRKLHLDHPHPVEEGPTKHNLLRKIRDILGEPNFTVWESDNECADEDGEKEDGDEGDDGSDNGGDEGHDPADIITG